MYNNIYDHVSSCISTNQFGFLRNRSTVQQLLTFLQSLHNSFAPKTHTNVIYFDIRKAFNTVCHDILLAKLHNIGVSGTALKFVRAYLTSRQQCVFVNNELSDYLPVTWGGVPQDRIVSLAHSCLWSTLTTFLPT